MDFESFLKWALPQIGLRWEGFADVHGQVARRLRERMADIEVGGLDDYRDYLDTHPDEWREVDRCCRVTISRFYRDGEVFDAIRATVLPNLVERLEDNEERDHIRAWSCGAASGEEPYTLRLCWAFDWGDEQTEWDLAVLASEAYEHMIDRAEFATYPESSLRELPETWRQEAFEDVPGGFRLDESYREGVEFARHDIRQGVPRRAERPIGLVLARYLPFTYFDHETQIDFVSTCREALRPGGFLVVGADESMPDETSDFERVDASGSIRRYRP